MGYGPISDEARYRHVQGIDDIPRRQLWAFHFWHGCVLRLHWFTPHHLPLVSRDPWPTIFIGSTISMSLRSASSRAGHRLRLKLIVPVSGCCPDLTPEDAVGDDRVKQHHREDHDAAPEHEHETRLRRGGFVDGDDEGDHVGPEGQRERAECRHEDQGDHVERPMAVMAEYTEREHDCGARANHREYEEIRPIDPTVQDWEMLGQCVTEDDDEIHQYRNRENADLAVRPVANLALAFPDQPASAQKRVAKAQADAAKDRKRREPADRTAGIFAVRELQSFDQGTDGHPLDESRDQRPASEAQIPDPPQPLRFV